MSSAVVVSSVFNPGKLLAQTRAEKEEQTRPLKDASSEDEVKGNLLEDSDIV